MKGFEAGVDYYNEKKNANVEVLGWTLPQAMVPLLETLTLSMTVAPSLSHSYRKALTLYFLLLVRLVWVLPLTVRKQGPA